MSWITSRAQPGSSGQRPARNVFPVEVPDGSGPNNDLVYRDDQHEGLPGLGLHAGEWRHDKLGELDGPVAHPRHPHLDRRLVHRGLGGNSQRWEVPGFKHFLIKPAPVGDLTFAKARYRSIHGEIVSDWRIENGTFRLSVTVPPGTTATVFVPGEGPVRTQARPSPPAGANGNRSYEATPGTYSFEAAL